MEGQFARLGVDAVFEPAVDAAAGQHLSYVARTRRAKWWRSKDFLPGEIGCFASHYRLWEKCVAAQEPLVILEDDVDLSDDFPECLRLAEQHVGTFGLVRLSALVPDRASKALIELESGRRLVRFLKPPWGTQGYVLSPAAAGRLLAHAQHWIEAVDYYLDQYWVHGVESNVLLPLCVEASVDLPSMIRTPRETPANHLGRPGRLWLSAQNSLRRSLYNLLRRDRLLS